MKLSTHSQYFLTFFRCQHAGLPHVWNLNCKVRYAADSVLCAYHHGSLRFDAHFGASASTRIELRHMSRENERAKILRGEFEQWKGFFELS